MEKEFFQRREMSLKEIIAEIDPFCEMHLLERIQMAMLIAAATKDVCVATMTECLEAEARFEYPLIEEDGEIVIDTETVYYAVEEIAKEALGEVYGKENIF